MGAVAWGLWPTPRFPSPLIKPDEPISGIRLSDPAPDKLLSASTDAVKKVAIHEMAVTDGVMTTRPVEDGLPIEAEHTVRFAPGGLHLMIVGLVAPLVEGDKMPVTLKFEKAGEVSVSFDVRAMGAPAPGPLSNAADPAVRAAAKI